MNLQVTKNVIDTIKPIMSDIDINNFSDIDNYHCNLLKYGRENVLLITNDSTLYSFVIVGLKSKDFKNIEEVIRESVFKLLLHNGFPQNQFEKILSSMEKFNYTKTSNRSVISSMNDMKKHIGVWLDRDIYEINQKINEIPFKKIGYNRPYELFQKLLEESN
jgi:IS30 family transposase